VRLLASLCVFCALSGCTIHRMPAWQRPNAVAPDPVPAELVSRSREAFQRGKAQPGKAGLPALDEAVTLAERALFLRNQLFREKVLRHEQPSWLFEAPQKEDLPALVAYGEALLEWSRRQGLATLMEEQDRLRESLVRAWKLDRNYQHAAPDRLLGILMCSLPVNAGADWIHANEHFEAAVAADPTYLPNQLTYAVEYALRMHEDKLYKRLLDGILAVDPDQLPPPLDANHAAQEHARTLRDQLR
jgi:hypothetical protein